jgi:hypothetical protein
MILTEVFNFSEPHYNKKNPDDKIMVSEHNLIHVRAGTDKHSQHVFFMKEIEGKRYFFTMKQHEFYKTYSASKILN